MEQKRLNKQDLMVIKRWLVRNGRPIDLARWNVHFEHGDRCEVIRILESYQNGDGGFGHGLEADSWNPNSSPMQTWCAMELLKEVNATTKDSWAKNVFDGLFTYLLTTKDFEDGLYLASIPSNNDHPHAPWWHWKESVQAQWGYNPTAALSGLMLHFSKEGTPVFKKGIEVAQQAVAHYFQNPMTESKHTLHGYQVIDETLHTKQIPVNFSARSLKQRILENITFAITKDTSQWGTSYCNLPTDLVEAPKGRSYMENKEITDRCVDYLIDSRNGEGVWDIPWTWGDQYTREFAVAENWWKGSKVVEHILLLKCFDRCDLVEE
jgi:hypothetical protein